MAILAIGELLGIGPDQLSGFIPYTAVEGSGGLISGINGSGISSIGGGTDTSAVSAIASAYATSAASGKLDNSASSQWYPMTGNPSGFLTSVDLTNYATTAYVDSSLSGKMDTSEASAFYPMSGNPSSFLVPEDITGLATTSYVDSSVSGKVDQSAFNDCCSSMSSYVSSIQQDTANISAAVSGITGGGGGGAVYHDATLTGSGLSSSPLGVNNMELVFDSASLSQTITGTSATVSVRYPISLISASSDATAQDVIYIVTGVS